MTFQPETETRSASLFHAAQEHLAGGVSAAARVHASLGQAFMTARGEGGRVWDVDGRSYIDLNTSNGAALLGHGNPAVRTSIEKALDMGLICGHETEYQGQVARKISEVVPSVELLRFANSGTETTWHAIRTARAYTGRSVVIKFEGHFHGYHDYLAYSCWPPLDQAGPDEMPTPYVESAGIPPEIEQFVIVLPWNDVEALERTLRAKGHDVAAVIMEPVNYDSGSLLPKAGYLEAVRQLTQEYGVVLIFDEILSGFRTGPGCAQGYYGVTPDLSCLGKALGGGTPLSAFGGSREVMSAVAPVGGAVHSGTFNGHVIPILAADAFLDEIVKPDFYPHLRELEAFFYRALQDIFERAALPVWVQSLGARFSLLFGLESEPRTYREAARWDREVGRRFFAAALEAGVYFHFAWHHGFSSMHTRADLEEALNAIETAAGRVARGQT